MLTENQPCEQAFLKIASSCLLLCTKPLPACFWHGLFAHLISYLVFPPISSPSEFCTACGIQFKNHPALSPSFLLLLRSWYFSILFITDHSPELLRHSLCTTMWPLAYNSLYYYLIYLCLCGLTLQCKPFETKHCSMCPHSTLYIS